MSSTFLATDGDGYEAQMGRWSRRLAGPFLNFVGRADGECVLDVGCGTGSLTFALAEQCDVKSAHGIDIAAPYIAHAARRCNDPRLVFQVGDGSSLPFSDRSFDRTLSLLALHFMPRPAQAIAEMRRVTKATGVVAAAVWDIRGGIVASRMFFDTAAILDPEANIRRARNYTRPMTRPGELKKAWETAGLYEVVETSLHIRMDFACFDDYWAPYEGRDGPGAEYVACLDAPMRDSIRQAVRLAYLDGEADGPRSYAATAWAVKGCAGG
ncbi:MAG: class I SAM-dependent methyltransferase [Rhodospirillales bacterium]|nr:class I SAM-dependent methyltransferase [Rhodospirillales bacterium]